MSDVTGWVLLEMLLELEGPFGMLFLLLWRGEIDDVLGMNRLSRASRRREGGRACFGMMVVLLLCVRRSSRGGIVIRWR